MLPSDGAGVNTAVTAPPADVIESACDDPRAPVLPPIAVQHCPSRGAVCSRRSGMNRRKGVSEVGSPLALSRIPTGSHQGEEQS
jgi:hypothetical protein